MDMRESKRAIWEGKHKYLLLLCTRKGSAVLNGLWTPPMITQLNPPQVLIMDDDETTSNYIKLVLQNDGIQSEYATDGEQGLIAAQRMAPSLIILDLAMPVVEGFEVIRRLRMTPETRHTPIIILTARDSDSYRIKAFELGANEYMLKPFIINELLVRVKSQLYKRPW
jgi:DNA-binding response OmpR family regulator